MIQKAAEATGDLIGKKIANKMTSVSEKSNKMLLNDEAEADVERDTIIKKDIYFQKQYSKLLMN